MIDTAIILWRQKYDAIREVFYNCLVIRMGRNKKQENAEKQWTGKGKDQQGQIVVSNIADQIPSLSPTPSRSSIPSPSPPLELHQRRPSVTKTKKIKHGRVLLSRRYRSLNIQRKAMKIRHQREFNQQIQSFKGNRRVIKEQNSTIERNIRTISDQQGQIGINRSQLEWYRDKIINKDARCQHLYDQEMQREKRLQYLNQEIGKKQQELENLTNLVQQSLNYSSEEELKEEEEELLDIDGVIPNLDDESEDDSDGPGGMAVGIGHYRAPDID